MRCHSSRLTARSMQSIRTLCTVEQPRERLLRYSISIEYFQSTLLLSAEYLVSLCLACSLFSQQCLPNPRPTLFPWDLHALSPAHAPARAAPLHKSVCSYREFWYLNCLRFMRSKYKDHSA